MWLLALQYHTPQNVLITPLPVLCVVHLFLTHLPHSSLQCPAMSCATMPYSTGATSSPVPPAAPCYLLGWPPGSPAGFVGLLVDWAYLPDCCLLLLPGLGQCVQQTSCEWAWEPEACSQWGNSHPGFSGWREFAHLLHDGGFHCNLVPVWELCYE